MLVVACDKTQSRYFTPEPKPIPSPIASSIFTTPSPIEEEEFITPLPPEVVPGMITLLVPPETEVTLNFWDELGRYHIVGPIIQVAGPEGQLEFEAESEVRPLLKGLLSGDYPVNCRAEIEAHKAGSQLHFQADLDVSRGGLFWIEEKEGELIIDLTKTRFYPLSSPGPGASLEEAIEVSLTVLSGGE